MCYIILFKISENMVSAPFKLSNLLLPSVTHTRIADIVFLFTGLNVILRDSMVKLYDGCSTLC